MGVELGVIGPVGLIAGAGFCLLAMIQRCKNEQSVLFFLVCTVRGFRPYVTDAIARSLRCCCCSDV